LEAKAKETKTVLRLIRKVEVKVEAESKE